MPEEGTRSPASQPQSPPPTGRPTAPSAQPPPWWRRRKVAAAVGGAVVLVAAAGTGAALATRSPASPPDIPAARAYASATGVLSGVGEAGQFADCSGTSDGDTVIGLFSDHANALAYAEGMIILGIQLHTPTAEVVGPNWVVNTSPAFAGEVVG